ncbi:MAG: argininosuccinate lyase [Candidatus Omnitrophota bacterium]|nr:argininosuccinate lyase [Candidatus Omnitrophota bacterium]
MTQLWGGRFEKKDMDPDVMRFTSSLDIDRILAKYDCLSSKVQVEMLSKCGFIADAEKKELLGALDELSLKIEEGTFAPGDHEDIHSAIQDYVESKAPEAAKKLHTGRSRNEQVVNDVRLYCRDSIDRVKGQVAYLQKALVELAEKATDMVIPGYTHLNRAQPVLFAHLAMAYVEMLQRDHQRLEDADDRLDISVMGSGAIAGSALQLDRKFIAEKLGFKNISANSIDAVSDRDFIAELIAALCFIAVHLSRMSEDFIIYSTPEFGFLDIGEEYCTGSSLMPQKKNPDVLELIRGKSSQVIGALNSVLVLLKGLPHSYNRDLQEDKKPLFESVELVSAELVIMIGLVRTVSLKKEAASKALEDEFIYATDLAEYLVRKGVAFADAHKVVGSIVKHCAENGMNISDLSISELRDFSEKLEEDVYGLLNSETSVTMKKTTGSTNPEFVKKEIKRWKKKLSGK